MSDIDYHKLQQKLFAMDPSDRAQDIERLRQSASGDGSAPAPEASVQMNESRSTAPREPMDEVAQLAALAGSNTSTQTTHSSEAEEMAALAGITLNEGQKKGKAGQLKGKEKVGKSKSSTSGEQKNVTRGKLVGSAENDDESIEEGPKWDSFKKGYDNYNKLAGAKGDQSGKKEPKPQPKQQGGQLSPEVSKKLAKHDAAMRKLLTDPQLKSDFNRLLKKAGAKAESIEESTNGLPPHLAKALAKHSSALSKIERNPALKEKFDRLMELADPASQLDQFNESLESYTQSKRTVNESDKESIKSELLRKLNQRK